jgi:MYXO-CTERM domain-containing protein
MAVDAGVDASTDAGGCEVDSDCSSSQFCDTATSACVAKIANGQPVPTIAGHTPTLNGVCTTAVGTDVCVSGVCDPKDNECGYANGDGPCTSTTASVCQSGSCSTTGKCKPVGGCLVSADCANSSTPVCDTATSQCVAGTGDAGTGDAGADSGHTDSGLADAGPDSSSFTIEGGGGCATAPSQSGDETLGTAGLLGLAFAASRRRRRR